MISIEKFTFNHFYKKYKGEIQIKYINKIIVNIDVEISWEIVIVEISWEIVFVTILQKQRNKRTFKNKCMKCYF